MKVFPPSPSPVRYLDQGAPFDLPAAQSDAVGDVGVVCVHGFTATPFEVKPVGEALARAGFHAVGPAVYGHAIAPVKRGIELFRNSKWEQWVESIREVVRRVRAQHARVFLYGQSMGGAIVLYLASEGLADAVATTAPAIRIPRAAELFAPLYKFLNVARPSKDKNAFFNPGYKVLASKPGYQLTRLAKQTRRRLARITCPVLVCHSRADDTVPPKKVPKLLQARVSGPVSVAWFERSGHTMPLDVEGAAVAETIAKFFVEQAGHEQGNHHASPAA